MTDRPLRWVSMSSAPGCRDLESQSLSPSLAARTTEPASSQRMRGAEGGGEPFEPPAIPGYDVVGELGRGGMGIVYRAYDRRRGQFVALKTMRWAEPAALYRIKQEFRALAGVSHRNLVTLHELIAEGKTWFLTMELVDGLDFLSFLRAPLGWATAETAEDITTACRRAEGREPPDAEGAGEFDTRADGAAPRDAGSQGVAPEAGADPSRVHIDLLRVCLRQLAEGISALHEAGRLHRDLKPSNVLVTRTGRVVVLDFGLVAEMGAERPRHDSSPEVLGTVSYMAPEQAAGAPVSPASDWYSVGVMLYEALTGRLPFRGRPLDVMIEKQRVEPPAPRASVPDVPEDLDALCVALLRLRPEDRPGGAEVLRRLGPATVPSGSPAPSSPSPGLPAPLIGRGPQLDALGRAFAEVERGRPAAVRVHGPAGSGKTALARRFLRDIAAEERAIVLQGRCYERESMPYKALDSVVDDLGRFLRRLPETEARELLPRDITPLVRVFPALRRVEAVAAAPRPATDLHDPPELRRRAFLALRELMARLGDRRPVVIAIDDLQWGDRDSAEALVELLRPPDPPALMLLVCHRSEDAASSPFVTRLSGREPGAGIRWREIAVGALGPAEAEDLAARLLGPQCPEAVALSGAIARESKGNPFFLTELVRHLQQDGPARDRPPLPEQGQLTLHEVLMARVRRLPAEARRLLEIVAVSGRPIGEAEASRAAGLSEGWSALAVLRAARLVRVTGKPGQDEVETYHDCVREAVTDDLTADDRAGHHLRLALAHETSGPADPEILADHFRKADRPESARVYYTQAADRAAEALAFDHAATLYRRAWELRPPGGGPEPALLRRLADALANAGRGREAAERYLAAAEGAPPAEAFELRHRGATQLLIGGEIDAGLAALDAVLRAVGMHLPTTPRRALASLLWHRLRLRLRPRGLGFRRRDEREIGPEEIRRVDVCWSVATGLGMVDYIRGGDFQTRHLHLALRAGEPRRVAKGLAWEAMQSAVQPSGLRRSARLLRMAAGLADELDDPYLHAMVAMSGGIAAYLQGWWARAHEALARAEALFASRCVGVTWELDTTRTFLLWCLTYLGLADELARRHEELSREAQARGDLFAAMNLGTYTLAVVRTWADEPEAGLAELDRVTGLWTQRGFHVQHYNALLGRAMLELYAGRAHAALEVIRSQWPAYRDSCLIRVQETRIELLQLRARTTLAVAASASDPGPFLRDAERDARRLAKERSPWATAHAAMIRGGVARLRGDRDAALSWAARAAAGYASADMPLYSAAAECRCGELLGGREGLGRVAESLDRMARRSVRNPGRLLAMYAPGFPGPPAAPGAPTSGRG